MRERFIGLLGVVAAAAMLSACTSSDIKDDAAAVEDRATGGVPGTQFGSEDSATTQGLEGGGTYSGDPLDDPSSLLSTRVIYFDYDSSEIRADSRATIDAHARYLAESQNAQVTLEGHADERGSREYNIALGERRAKGVRRLMSVIGASGQQLRTVSFGEERPAAEGHDESAWSQNRRVEIVYLSR